MKHSSNSQEMFQKAEQLYQMYSSLDDKKKKAFLDLVIRDLTKPKPSEVENPSSQRGETILTYLLNKDVGASKCPHCGNFQVIKNGTRNGKQRYLCRNCGKTFMPNTNTVFFHSKHDYKTWEKYLDCMVKKLSLRKSAAICKIGLRTAFEWRHKIQNTLHEMQMDDLLNGEVKVEESKKSHSSNND